MLEVVSWPAIKENLTALLTGMIVTISTLGGIKVSC